MAKDKCVMCGADTQYDELVHIDLRMNYIEGAGQLCGECANRDGYTEEGKKVARYFDTFIMGETANKDNCICGESKAKIKIELNEFDYTGSSNDIYGMEVKVNGTELPLMNTDTATIIRQILEHLGYEVEIIETLDN